MAASSPSPTTDRCPGLDRTIAAFDFDGTLTRRDTLGPFLVWLCGPRAVAAAVVRTAPGLAAAVSGLGNRDASKAALFARLLAGRPVDAVQRVVDRYAERVVRTALRPDTVGRLRWHQRSGHQLVIVSASPALYVEPVARRLGVPTVLATQLEVGPDGRLTGRLLGGNVRGPEKARLLRAHLDGGWRTLYAYGDSAGDRELLAMADVGLRVRRVTVPHRPAQ